MTSSPVEIKLETDLTKTCDLKAQQKLFFLQQNTAASCCRAYAQSLDHFATVSDLVQHWRVESQDLDKGIAVKSCESCWHSENQGQLSYRQLPRPPVGNWIELWINNACNQMCSYCGPKFSSQWERSIVQQGMFEKISATAKKNLQPTSPHIENSKWLTDIADYVRSQPKHSVTVKVLGGEPLMQIRQLQTLLEFNIDHVQQLRINTNLNPPTNKFLIWLLQQVPSDRLFFDISIDATLAFNHVSRAGFDADKFLANLKLVRESGVQYSFLAVANVLSIFDIENMITWCRIDNHPLQILPLNNPACLDARWLPNHFKDQLRFDSMPDLISDILEPNEAVDIKLFEQYNYLSQYFSRTNIDPTQTSNHGFGLYWQWLENKFK